MSSSATARRSHVVERNLKGALTVEGLEGHGHVTLPPGYVAEHVALGYALTVHKAQGSTVDCGIVLVDEQMTAQQLYVAMSRGREMNTALVVEQRCDPGVDIFWRSRRLTPVELLANVIERNGTQRLPRTTWLARTSPTWRTSGSWAISSPRPGATSTSGRGRIAMRRSSRWRPEPTSNAPTRI